MKRKLFCILLSLSMLLCFMPQAAWADPDTAIKYYDWDANQKKLVEQTLPDTSATVTVTTTTTEWKSETASWYVAEGTVTIDQRVTVTGDVNLLLKDNCNLTINGGISVPSGNSLTIYAQSNTGDSIGALKADATEEATYSSGTSGTNCAGIGGDNNGTNTGESGTITINGGKITAKGGESGAGIGCGNNNTSDTITNGTITINGGDITAGGGKDAAGIGGGKNGNGSYITINGGKVGVTGGSDGAGIGGGYFGKGTNIIVNDGEVKASGGYCGAGIGGGSGGNGENIEISGGKVTSLAAGGAGIGGGKGGNGTNITISGGTVISESGSDGGAGIGGGQGANGTNITIRGGTVTATAIGDAAGIGGGKAYSGLNNTGNGTKITISGGAVTARCLGIGGAGIGGGREGTGSNITISGSVILNVQGGKADGNSCGTGAAIGNGGSQNSAGTEAINGAEVLPNTNGLTSSGSITYYTQGVKDLSNATPITINSIKITFDLNGKGTSSEYNTVATSDGGIVPQPTAPTATGYTFDGWYTEAACTNQFNFSTPVSADKTLYAKWIENTGYKVKFNTGDGATTIADKTVTWTGAILSGVNDPTKAGYTFNGWKYGTTNIVKPSESDTGTSYSILVPNDDITGKEITLVAQWTENSYTITFNTAGGTSITEISGVKWADKISSKIANAITTKAGYTFTEWKCVDSPVTDSTTYASLAASDTVTSITLTAQWTEKMGYTVSYNVNGGSETIADKTIKWTGNVLEGVTSPTREGYTFTGWKHNGNGVAPTATYASLVPEDNATNNTITLVAQWEDTTAPVISGIENGKTYYVGQEFTATDVNTVTVTINGTAVTPTEGKYKLTTTGENVIVATDSEKNATTLTVTVSRKYGGGGSKKSQTLTDEQKQAELEKAAAEKKAAEIAEVKTTTAGLDSLKARSSRTEKGNVKVVAKLSSAEKAKVAEFKELGYTVKYRFYRSPKKSSGYKAMLEKSSTTYINTYGKDGTRYYYKVQIRVYDADGTLIAKAELKDCKYATRIF